jgi:hypothetical protein
LLNNTDQAKMIQEYLLSTSSDPNNFIVHINAVLDMFCLPQPSDCFEKTFEEVGKILGFKSSRPDKETSGKGPDNLWALGEGKYLVVECKSEATTATISKDYCNQLGGSTRWFYEEYDTNFQCTPIMVHNTNCIDNLATPIDRMRIIIPDSLDKFKRQIKCFAIALVQAENWQNENKISSLLLSYKLRKNDIVPEYTVNFTNN